MSQIKSLSITICELFATDQNFHAEQQSDGRYFKKTGKITPAKIESMLDSDGAIAVYQRNINDRIKWICYDFDIIKSQLEEQKRLNAEKELKATVSKFCTFLDKQKIKYLIEYSGNRGVHIWITFQSEISYKIGHEITTLILEHAELNYNPDLIGIDLFPHSKKITNSVGACVKIPLSKHKKSGAYSYFLDGRDDLENINRYTSLSPHFLSGQLSILDKHESLSLENIEKKFNVFLSEDNFYHSNSRIKEIMVSNLTLPLVLQHWENEKPLKKLKVKIQEGNLSNQERKLLVGLFTNVVSPSSQRIGIDFLMEIFKTQNNYNEAITKKAIHTLSSFYFPNKEQIEDVLKERFSTSIDDRDLLDCIFTNVISFDRGYFDICVTDVEITRNAEMKYLIQNDEAQSRKVFNEICNINSNEYLNHINVFIDNYEKENIKYYVHERLEENKVRSLVSLECLERITTSIILKQLTYFYDLPNDDLSHGYKVRKGFNDGFIFEPWLYLWIKFLSNISSAITNESHSEYYIIKTDIASFYDKIDHDKLKRLLLDSSPLEIIRSKISALDEKSLEKYKKIISLCLKIAKDTVGSDKGLPQGPAYARFFAEIYLSDIDYKFKKLLNEESVFLYQRYVDDIFIICESEEAALANIDFLASELNLLGLELKQTKTVIKKVKDFTPDYDKYRSQSKYSVDKVSSRYLTATDEEKSYAIDEFIKLILSDTKQEDYSFIFSHLRGVEEVEQFKNNEITGIISSGVGRGSLYRNLFIHILENENIWHYLTNADCYNSLQSEVLTSTIINFIEEGKSSRDKFAELMSNIINKLSMTKMVQEHLFYMRLLTGLDIEYKKIDAASILEIISSFPLRLNIKTTEPLLDYINTEINSMHNKYKFVDVMYAITHATQINKVELTKLSSLFYSFISLHMYEKEFQSKEKEINESLTYTIKFHYLVSLFSLSKNNEAKEILISMWRYCACLFNNFDYDIHEKIDYDWLHKIQTIEIDNNKLYLILSSIVDGELFRGTLDKKSIFKTYHTLLLVLLSDKLSSLQIDDIDTILKKIKDEAVFYEWIIDREQTELLPNTREWFDSNIIHNNTIMLKRGSNVLIRKPNELFSKEKKLDISDDGYSEFIEKYDIQKLDNIKSIMFGLDLKGFVDFLYSELAKITTNEYPNVFTNTPLLKKKTLEPFTNELYNARSFIFEDHNGVINIQNATKNKFIELMFKKYAEATSDESLELFDKYISKLPNEIDIETFLKYLSRQFNELNEMDDVNSIAIMDLSVASSLYCCLEERNESFISYNKFVDYYIPSDSYNHELHVFSVNTSMQISDSSPDNLVNSILRSIVLTKKEAFPFLIINIEDGLNEYIRCISRIISKEENSCPVDISSFKKCQVKLNQIRQSVHLGNSSKFLYGDVRIVNYITGTIDILSIDNTHYISTATHTYNSQYNGVLYLVAIPSSISKAFEYIEGKYNSLTPNNSTSYLPYQICSADIVSLDRFDNAVNVIHIHKSIQYNEARELLIRWLSIFPERFRGIFVLIIAAHQLMTPTEVESFCNSVLELIKSSQNVMMIKKTEDYNGTIRCFHTNDELSRILSYLDPSFVDNERSDSMTIVTDVIISGSQICKALKYYITGEGESSAYFDLRDSDGLSTSDKLKKIKNISLSCILYTEDAISKIEETLNELIPGLGSVDVSHGRKINGNAFFGTTVEIGNKDKEKILGILSDEEQCKIIYSFLKLQPMSGKEFRNRYVMSNDKISNINLVARYKSLPKKCFQFLYYGVKTNNDLHPMDRVLEQNDMR